MESFIQEMVFPKSTKLWLCSPLKLRPVLHAIQPLKQVNTPTISAGTKQTEILQMSVARKKGDKVKEELTSKEIHKTSL